jgi:hypothetical protein
MFAYRRRQNSQHRQSAKEYVMTVDQPPPAFHCEVESNIADTRISLRGRVLSNVDSVAKYSLVVEKAGSSGKSSIKQAGEFHTLIDQPVFVGSVVLDYQKSTTYTVKLTITSEDRLADCEFMRGKDE